ncbi:hypothetical protein ONZ45_g18946 [Pleurotus djamor]|nr:hypothetical protein ONZ45_g18946 [Pleurotus djamor]
MPPLTYPSHPLRDPKAILTRIIIRRFPMNADIIIIGLADTNFFPSGNRIYPTKMIHPGLTLLPHWSYHDPCHQLLRHPPIPLLPFAGLDDPPSLRFYRKRQRTFLVGDAR